MCLRVIASKVKINFFWIFFFAPQAPLGSIHSEKFQKSVDFYHLKQTVRWPEIALFFKLLTISGLEKSYSLLQAIFGPGRMNINEYADKFRDNWYQNRRNEWERCMKLPSDDVGNYSMARQFACWNILDKKSHEHVVMASHQMEFWLK